MPSMAARRPLLVALSRFGRVVVLPFTLESNEYPSPPAGRLFRPYLSGAGWGPGLSKVLQLGAKASARHANHNQR